MIVYDVLIVGGGPAGMSAALTSANQGLQCLLLSNQRGGKLRDITHLTNWYGSDNADGKQLTSALYAQLKKQKTRLTVKQSDVTDISIAKSDDSERLFAAQLKDGEQAFAKTLIIATGTMQRQQTIPGERTLLGKGVSYCITCDIPYFRNKTIAIIAAEGRAPETNQLTRQVKQVYLLAATATPTNHARNIQFIETAKIEKIAGKERVAGLVYRDNKTKRLATLTIDGVFIESKTIGDSSLVHHLVDINDEGFVKVDHATMVTTAAGVFAAGDITDGSHKQVSIALADGVKASLSAKKYIQSKEVTWLQ
jgi:alkyl hydroperoxide reductase subunit F